MFFNKVTISVALLLMACSNDDADAVHPVDNKTCLITAVNAPQVAYTITRDDLGLPIRITHTNEVDDFWIFKYDESGRLVSAGNEKVILTYEYDNLNRVIAEKIDENCIAYSILSYKAVRTFTYNDKGYLDSAYYSQDDYERYEYDATGNLIKKFVKYSKYEPEFMSNEYLSFDDKKNPLYEFSFYQFNVISAGQTLYFAIVNPVRHKNNVVESKLYKPNGTVDSISITYQYNEFGYPVSYGNGVITYGYSCD